MTSPMESPKVFVWVAHPKPDSLCGGIADAYQTSAEAVGALVRRMDLHAMHFDTAFQGYDANHGALEPDLARWQDNIRWADHILIVHPCWWGTMPAQAKAVFDRALLPGFGFKFTGDGSKWDRLLAGKTADVIMTSDTPPILDTLLYVGSGRRLVKKQILEFCGITPKTIKQFGSVKASSPEKRQGWLNKAGDLGARAAQSVAKAA
tara:strand:+ start:8200 stop:8817 length:618 start_codon:yes stop_codon:yes gene_type:complete